MRKLSYVKFLSVLLLQLGLISMSHMGRASTETSVPGACNALKALDIVASNSCAVFGPGTAGDTTYELALISNYAVSGCIAGDSTETTNSHVVYIDSVSVTQTQDGDGNLQDITALNLEDLITTINQTSTIGAQLLSSGGATLGSGTTACTDTVEGEIAAPIYQMRNAKATAVATTGQQAGFLANWADEHHNEPKYAFKCTLSGEGVCTWATAITGGESVTFNTITASAEQTFPASQLVLVTKGIDPSKFPGDTITLSITLASAYSASTDIASAAYAFDGVTPSLAY